MLIPNCRQIERGLLATSKVSAGHIEGCMKAIEEQGAFKNPEAKPQEIFTCGYVLGIFVACTMIAEGLADAEDFIE